VYCIRNTTLLGIVLLSLWQGLHAATLPESAIPKTIKQAMADVKSGQANKAYKTLIKYEEQLAGVPQYDYLLGLSALESGDAGYAVFALQRSISIDKSNAGAVLDLGRAYYKLGEYDESEKSLRKVLAYNPPTNVKNVVANYLSSIHQIRNKSKPTRFQNNVVVNFGSGYDSNANSAPSIDNYLQTPLHEQSQASPSAYASTDLAYSGSYAINKSLSSNISSKYSAKQFEKASFVNSEMYNLSTGFQKIIKTDMLSANISYMQSVLDGKKSGSNTGLAIQWQQLLKPRLKLSMFTQLARLRNPPESASRDTNQTNFGWGFIHDSKKPGVWQGTLTFLSGKAIPRRSDMPYGNANYGVMTSFVHIQSDKYKTTNMFSAVFINSSYEGEFPTETGMRSRRDSLSTYSAASIVTIEKFWQITVSLASTKNNSSIGLFDFERVASNVTIRRVF